MERLAKTNSVLLQVESFPVHQAALFDEAQRLGLTHLKTIGPDHFFSSYDLKPRVPPLEG
jgi:hypothetical protein